MPSASPTPEELARRKTIAAHLIRMESQQLGVMRLYPNSYQMRIAARALEEIGFRKPFLKSHQQFVIDCFLTYQDPCELLLSNSYLVGPRDAKGRLHVWDGFGRYKAFFATTPEFKITDTISFAVNIAPIYQTDAGGRPFCDILEVNKTLLAKFQANSESLLEKAKKVLGEMD